MKYSCLVIPLLFITMPSQIDVNEFEIDDLYKISVPVSFEEEEGMNDLASLQVVDWKNGVFMVILDEKKESRGYVSTKELRENFKALQYQLWRNLSDESRLSGYEKKIKHGHAFEGQLNGVYKGSSNIYHLLLAESKTHFFKLIIWTAEESDRENYHTIKMIMDSFTILKPNK